MMTDGPKTVNTMTDVVKMRTFLFKWNKDRSYVQVMLDKPVIDGQVKMYDALLNFNSSLITAAINEVQEITCEVCTPNTHTTTTKAPLTYLTQP